MRIFLLNNNILRSSLQIQHVTNCPHSITFGGITLMLTLDRKLWNTFNKSVEYWTHERGCW